MKRYWILAFVVFLAGCTKTPDPIFTPKTPKSTCPTSYFLSIEIIPPNDGVLNDLDIRDNEIIQSLKSKAPCINIIPNSKSLLEISYGSEQNVIRQDKIFLVKEEIDAKFEISAALNTTKKNHTFQASSSLKTSGQKILGIGQNVTVSDKDRSELVDAAIKRLLSQLMKVLTQNSESFELPPPEPLQSEDPEPEEDLGSDEASEPNTAIYGDDL